MSEKTIIIGAGFASATLSNLINDQNLTVFDKGRGPGGRSSTRRVEGVGNFDHGLQFVSPESLEFGKFLKENLRNCIKLWKGDFVDFDNKKIINKKKRWIGKNGNNDFVKKLISAPSFYQKELEKVSRKNNRWLLEFKDLQKIVCDTLLLTIPMEQCKKIIDPLNIDVEFKKKMNPSLTTMLAFVEKTKIKSNAFVFNKSSILGWASKESSKKRDINNPSLELWTLQSTVGFAEKNYKNFKSRKLLIMNLMIEEFCNLCAVYNKKVIHKDIHGWLYAYKEDFYSQDFFWDKKTKLGICGDWMCGAKAEDAWRSASGLADQINNS
jgi:predicted NAD/FAD-dependent oxidoreductase